MDGLKKRVVAPGLEVCVRFMNIAYHSKTTIISASMWEHVQSCLRCRATLAGKHDPSRN